MLLRKKTKYAFSSEWALVLDRLADEFVKNKAVDRLTEVFPLSHEEARDLIENTPIILLDNIPFDLAGRIKDFFAQTSIDCSVTNDSFTKRKCFRAVWPEQPDLTRFLSASSLTSNYNLTEPIPIAEMKNDTSSIQTNPSIASSNGGEQFVAEDEKKALRDLTLDLQRENELLKLQMEKTGESIREEEKRRFNDDLDRIRLERTHSEELVNRLRSENVSLTNKIDEAERKIQLLKQTAETEAEQTAKQQISELRAQLEQLRADYVRAQNAIRVARSEGKQFQTDLSQAQKSLLDARGEIEDLKRMLSQAQANAVHFKEEVERTRFEAENQMQAQSGELEEWKRKANEWSVGYFKVVKENEFLRSNQSEELESLRSRNQQLSVQLEQALRQNKDFVAKLEQQELIQKRLKAAGELVERESQLKTLVQKQQTLEEEIRVRETEIKKVLSEQETIEQEILKAKQVQKYIIEQAKLKEKSRFTRPAKGIGPSESTSSNQDFLEPSSND